MEPGFAKTWPLSTSSFFEPLSKIPTLSPAMPSSRVLLNISMLTATVLLVGFMPTNSTFSLDFIIPLSILPVATVPLPSIEKTSSMAIRNGFSVSLFGSGMNSSIALINSTIGFAFSSSAEVASNAFKADPLIIGVVSPGNSYFFNNSLTSDSTKLMISGSSTASHLLRKTIKEGRPTCFAKSICSLV